MTSPIPSAVASKLETVAYGDSIELRRLEKKGKIPITQARIKQLLFYDPDTGAFKRAVSSRNSVAGKTPGRVTSSGYIQAMFDGECYFLHRLAFLYMEGKFPPEFVDHINGQRLDNRWGNLRHASRKMNNQNIKAPTSRNASGFLGVDKLKTRWRATISLGGVPHYLGAYGTPELAHQAYVKAKREHHEGNTL